MRSGDNEVDIAMDLSKLMRTVVHLRPTQVWYQLCNRLRKLTYKRCCISAKERHHLVVYPIARNISLTQNGCFHFIQSEHEFSGWNDATRGMLWAYNQNYFDWLNQPSMDYATGAYWIDKFIEEIDGNRVGLDPYPIALRCINWIKFISRYCTNVPEETRRRWDDSMYSQYCLLGKKLEYHLLGNHLLEDAFSLYIGALYFQDSRMYKKAARLLLCELREQILPDGAHYEQSAMYHCILLDRLLDCLNMASKVDMAAREYPMLQRYASMMLGHLDSIIYEDGTLPLMNDAAYDIAPSPADIFDYAHRLEIDWKSLPMRECGYRKLKNERMEALVDVGNITASYQPGHSHADTFNFELRIDGVPFIVDTGISTYDKTPRRQYERSTAAHNTVEVDGKDSSEVWGGFRVGRRAHVQVLEDREGSVTACHDGYGKNKHTRTFRMEKQEFCIIDELASPCTAVAYLHLAPGVEPEVQEKHRVETAEAVILLDENDDIVLSQEKVSTRYNSFAENIVVKIGFRKKLKIQIILK